MKAAIMLVASLAAAAPARAAISRSTIFLDGDAAIRSLDSEDILLTQSKPGTTTTEFGSAVALGRLNGDALADAVVGQRTQNKVFVYLGSAAARSAPWFGDPNLADIVITAPTNTTDKIQQFGFSVAIADLDGDGVGDLLVGAPFSDPGGKTDAGLAYAILGVGSLATGAQVSLAAPPPGVTVVKMTRGTAGKAGDLLGFAVSAGPLAGPPADTLFVVTARDADAVAPARADAGAAHVARGSVLPSGGGTFDLTTGSAATFFGADAADALGESVAFCDVDGAGDADLLVGAIFGDGPANVGVNRGEALLFLGENIVSGFHAGATSAASADMTIAGAGNGDDLGYTVGCGDVNGDGKDDLLLGAIFADSIGEARPSAGEAYVLRGRASQPDPMTPGRRELIDPKTSAPQTPVDLSVATDPNDPAPDGADLALFGATTADELGFSLAAGDLDGDGAKDLVVGARRYDRDASRVNVGATYVLRGSAGFLNPGASGLSRGIDLHAGTSRAFETPFVPPADHLPDRVDGIVIGATHDDHSSWAVATGDLNDDGGDELLISAIGDLTRVPGFRGEAYLLSFADIDGDGASDLLDNDNDNDGIPNDDELDGVRTGFLTDPSNPDTDGDGIQDGTEEGFTCPGGGGVFIADCDDPNMAFTSTDPNLPLFFKPDRQPSRVTSPVDDDTDDDGLADGAEDANANGRLDSAESDPSLFDTDGDLIFVGSPGTELEFAL